MNSPRKKWNNDKKAEMERLRRILAEDGDSESRVFLAVKLMDEALSEKSPIKSETAIDMLCDSAQDGNRMAAKILEEFFANNFGITANNKKAVLKLLSRTERDIKCQTISKIIMTTICDNQNRRLKESEFRQRLQRLVLQTNSSPITDNHVLENELIVNEKIVALNLEQVFSTNRPIIDLTDELNFKDVFTSIFQVLRVSFKIIDKEFITSLMITFCLSLFVNYFYFKPNFRLLYESFFDLHTFSLSLQLLEVYSFVSIVDRLYNYNNYKLWVKVIKAFDKDCNLESTKFFSNCLLWMTIFLFSLAVELNIELIFDPDFQRAPTICSSMIRQMMAFLSFLVLIRNNSNLLQIFFPIFHYLCQNYLQEIQTHFPFIYDYLTNYTIIFTFLLIIITTKPILSSTSFHLILIPNLLVHILILSSDYDSESLTFVISNIIMNIHSIFGAIFILVLLRITGKVSYLSLIPKYLIFADFYKNFFKTFNWISFVVNLLLIKNIGNAIKRFGFSRKVFILLVVILCLFLQIVFHNERQIKLNSEKSYSYDRYYDKCFDSDIDHNITKQIECLDLTLSHKLLALSRVNSIKLIEINNNLKNIFDFITLGLNNYVFSRILSKEMQNNYNLNNWRVFEFEVTFLLKYSSTNVSVRLEHQNRDFIEKLKVGDIYEIEMFYDPIKSTAILFSAKCKTCWDVIHWNNTLYA